MGMGINSGIDMGSIEREFHNALQKFASNGDPLLEKLAKKNKKKEGEVTKVTKELKRVMKILYTLGRLGANLNEVLDSKGKKKGDREFASDQVRRAERALDDVKKDIEYLKDALKETETDLSKI